MINVAREIIGTQPVLAIPPRHWSPRSAISVWKLCTGWPSSVRLPASLAFLGYLVGQINIGGFSLGVGAVLLVGLALGAFAPKAQIVGRIGLTDLIMFFYGIGVLYGRH
jgi:hypothetical protein